MEVETDALSSPPRATGAQGQDLEGPKSDGQAQQTAAFKTSATQPREKMAVEVDAVPSSARPDNSPLTTSAKPESEEQVDQNGDIPKSPLSPDKNKTPKGRKHKCFKSSHEIPSQSQNLKSRTRQKNTTNVQVSNCNNVFFGNVHNYTINNNGSTGKKEKENEDMQTKTLFKKLLLCQKQLANYDMVIISEHLTKRGLNCLSHELFKDDSEIDAVETQHKEKGQKEVTYQTLARWKYLNSGNDLTPMLNVICAGLVLKEVYQHGGKGALEALQDHHFKD